MNTQLRELRIPDFVTLIGLSSALIAIYLAFKEQFFLAYIFIIAQYALDGLDGKLARKLGGGRLGMFLDSFSDFTILITAVLFGFFMGLQSPSFLVAGLLFILAGSIRLSFFTAQNLENKREFIGIPSVFCVFILCTTLILNFHENLFPMEWIIALYLFFAYGMISDLRIKK